MIRTFKAVKGQKLEFSFKLPFLVSNTALTSVLKKHKDANTNISTLIQHSNTTDPYLIEVEVPASLTANLQNEKYYYSILNNANTLMDGYIIIVSNATPAQQIQKVENIQTVIIDTLKDIDSEISDVGDLIPIFEARL